MIYNRQVFKLWGSIKIQLKTFIISLKDQIIGKFRQNARISGRVVLDEKASSVKYEVVVEKIKRSLLVWRVSPSTTGKAILTLRIQI
ncbi:after-VIT domain-containing protein [Nostoc muscorum FACHB-395]|nr:after-VIT domain-containing protein [Desmonostoc muscorum FACHB-395]